MAEKIKSKDEFAALIEKSTSQYKSFESDSKVIDLDNLSKDMKLSPLEKNMAKVLNLLFAAIDSISLKLANVSEEKKSMGGANAKD